jgi:hypothetical protein
MTLLLPQSGEEPPHARPETVSLVMAHRQMRGQDGLEADILSAPSPSRGSHACSSALDLLLFAEAELSPYRLQQECLPTNLRVPVEVLTDALNQRPGKRRGPGRGGSISLISTGNHTLFFFSPRNRPRQNPEAIGGC